MRGMAAAARDGAGAGAPGYPIRVLPTSGVTSEAVLWMINAEIVRLLAAG
ncbi:MAG: hypothetical protein JXP34_20110 [Planctomycetes bacterium]|nr:hypothetical protein [Planctomycetota bacterium]